MVHLMNSEINPFKLHFWKHIWSKWSKPIPTLWEELDGSNGGHYIPIIYRQCKICGLIQRKVPE
jgi:hypothetical protein